MATPKSTKGQQRKGEPRICKICGTSFVPWESTPGWLCSYKCRSENNKVPAEERFWKHVLKTESCWIWTAGKLSSGYGSIRVADHAVSTHRLSWEIHFGEIPDGLSVLHRCDNPPCVNPAHLFLGTDADNVHDMLRKGRNRSNPVRGEINNKAKLTNDQVIEIRQQYESGMIKQRDLAVKYGVCRDTIRKIVHRIYWTHI